MRGSAVFDQLSAGDYSLDTATTRLTMNSAEGVMQRGVVELGRPATSEVLVGTVEVVPVRALLLGERLDTRALQAARYCPIDCLRPHRAARRDIAGKGTRRGNQQ
jgi:hypothetical protein